jgi:hypothetical protein
MELELLFPSSLEDIEMGESTDCWDDEESSSISISKQLSKLVGSVVMFD